MELSGTETQQSHFWRRWYGRLLLLLVGVGFLTAGFAPVNQFYLGWVGLVPWLVVLHGTRSQRSAFFWSWVSGTLFFIANMWWMAKVTAPGMIALMAILGLYWGVAGIIIRGAGMLKMEDEANALACSFHFPFSIFHSPLFRCIGIAAVWISVGELLRGTWPWHGLPWLYLGYTQSPVLVVCQIADFTGVLGVSFLIAAVNAWVALCVINGRNNRALAGTGIAILVMVALVIFYGIFRMGHESLVPGPKVLVVQPNYPQDNSTGNKGATADEMLDFHVRASRAALSQNPDVDLTVWSETIMPPFNAEAGVTFQKWNVGQMIDAARFQLHALANKFHSAFLVGARYEANFSTNSDGAPEAADKRNSAYLFDRQGTQTDLRFDKIHLVPFGEFIPFKVGFPALYRLMIYLGPDDMKSYGLQFGDENQLTVFPLERDDAEAWRFVTPICFEDIDPGLCAKMFRPGDDGKKRADFLVNITNDGWFQANENSQHLQAAIFRSIENRVPSARSVNTGISGFIDPLGRTNGLLSARTEGTSVGVMMLDERVTFFTRWGQLFGWLCAAVTSLIALTSLISWLRNRKVIMKD